MGAKVGAVATTLLLGVLIALPASALGLRTATRAERLALTPVIADYLSDPPACRGVGLVMRVSTVKSRYARVSFNNTVRQAENCSVGDGYSLWLRKLAGGYRHLEDRAWDTAPCRRFGRRVALDLTRDYRLPCD